MMSPQLVAGARVGFNDNSVTMGNWGQGARSALPMVGEVFQQALRNKWIDPKVEFDIPRARPKPPPQTDNPVLEIVQNALEAVLRQLRTGQSAERPADNSQRQ